MARLAVIGLVLFLAATPVLADHDKSDVATTDDGNTFIGEFKSIQNGVLNLTTDAAGTLSIAWRRVTGLTSKFKYRVEVSGGVQHYGTLGPAKEPRRLSIVSASGTIEVDFADVFEIVPIEDGFWNKLDGSLNFGLTYTQANDALQYNLSFDVNYRSRRNYASLSGQSIFNSQIGGETTNQHYVKLIVVQAARNEWGAFELGQLQSNPDQGYDLRLIAGGGAAKFFHEDAAGSLVMALGAVYNREDVTGGAEVDESVEALVGVTFRRFKRTSRSPSTQVGLQTFTNMTDTPRFRAALNFEINWEILNNFTFSFQVNDNYDSNPPGVDSRNNDLSVVTSVGYTF